jgi:hypothetical protein
MLIRSRFVVFFFQFANLAFGQVSFGQEPSSVLEGVPPVISQADSPSPSSQHPVDGGCSGAAWSNPLFENASLFVLKNVGNQTIFAVRNPLDWNKAFSISLIWDAETSPLPSVIASITAEPAVDDPDWCAGVCGMRFNWHHLIPKNGSPCMTAAIAAYNAWAAEHGQPTISVDDAWNGYYIPIECHTTKPDGIHTRGPNDDLVIWQDVVDAWCEIWKSQNPVQVMTPDIWGPAIDHIRNDRPSQLDPPITVGNTATGTNVVDEPHYPKIDGYAWPPGRFGSCLGDDCKKATVSHSDWLDLRPICKRNNLVRTSYCPGNTTDCCVTPTSEETQTPTPAVETLVGDGGNG